MAELPTLAELSRRLDRVEREIDERIVTLDVFKAERLLRERELVAYMERMKNVEDSQRWAFRFIATQAVVFISTLVTAIIIIGFNR